MTNRLERLVPLLSEFFREAAVLLSRRFRLPTNVRLWLKADIQGTSNDVCFRGQSGHSSAKRVSVQPTPLSDPHELVRQPC